MVKTICFFFFFYQGKKRINTQKRIEAQNKNSDKDGKALQKLMNNAVYRIDVKLVSNKKDYLKWTSKPSYMSH